MNHQCSRCHERYPSRYYIVPGLAPPICIRCAAALSPDERAMADGAARDSAYAASVAAERERDRFDTVGPRFVAGLVDALVFLPVAFVDSYMAAPERGILVLLAWGLVSYSVYWLYSVLLHARYGQTVGKMVARVKVLDVSEGRIPTPQPGIPVVRTDTHSPLTA